MGFATNYYEVIPFVLGAEPKIGKKESFGESANLQTIKAVAEFIVSVIEGKTAVVLTPEESLKTLRGTLTDIVETIRKVDPTPLKNRMGILDELIWKEEEEGLEDIGSAIRKASAYLVLNQILFYNALQQQTPTLKPLRNVRTMAELQQYFSAAYEIDYEPVFTPKVSELLPDRAAGPVNNLISIVTQLQIDRYRHDILGPLFHELIPFAVRKRLAAYYTENSSADLLARLAVRTADDTVLDLSCGSGTLLVSAYNVKRELSDSKDSTGALHRKLLKEILGCDITYFAAHLAVINLALREPLAETNKVLVTAKDAFRLKPYGNVEFLMGEPIEKGLSLRGEEHGFEISMVNLVIQNPQYPLPSP